MSTLLLFTANFLFIFLKAFQQRNVTGLFYLPVIPTSFLMALTEVYVIATISMQAMTGTLGVEQIAAIALGGGLGCLASMWCHDKIFK
jgi:hypothetical protein